MQNDEKWIFILFIFVFIATILAIYQMINFWPTYKKCENNFAIIDKCGCVPCSWSNADKYNNQRICFNQTFLP